MESKISKMLKTDGLVIWFWVFFMWLVLVPVYLKVASLTESNSLKLLAFIAAALVGLFNTISLLALKTHLNKNKTELYSEDIRNKALVLQEGKSWDLVKVFDVLFILVLCYVTLLIPILMQGRVLVGSGESSLSYAINPFTALLSIFAFLAYMWYMLRNSEKELKGLINNVYGQEGSLVKETYSGKETSL